MALLPIAVYVGIFSYVDPDFSRILEISEGKIFDSRELVTETFSGNETTLVEIADEKSVESMLRDSNHCQVPDGQSSPLVIPSVLYLKAHKCGSTVFKKIFDKHDHGEFFGSYRA